MAHALKGVEGISIFSNRFLLKIKKVSEVRTTYTNIINIDKEIERDDRKRSRELVHQEKEDA